MISIVMPYYMRQAQLDRSLEAYRRIYRDIEIVICDDGSPEPVVADGCTVISLPVKDYALNPCVPINRAVEAAASDVIVLTCPEIVHKDDVFTSMRESLTDDAYVIASCLDETGVWLARPGVVNGIMPIPDGAALNFCVMFKRELWKRAGGFDEQYRQGQGMEDTDWLWRLHRIGAHFILRPDLVVYHYRSGTCWPAGGLERNRELFWRKWPEHRHCVVGVG